jgi:hypothetical protein
MTQLFGQIIVSPNAAGAFSLRSYLFFEKAQKKIFFFCGCAGSTAKDPR